MRGNTQAMIDVVSKYRNMPRIKKGQRCDVDGKSGQIFGGNSSANLNVIFDGDKRPKNCHPNYKMRIFDSAGTVIYASDDC
jgi:hypothetical protein